MKRIITVLALCLIVSSFMTPLFGQDKVILEGYVFADDNSGYLRQAYATLYDKVRIIKGEAHSNKEGFFSIEIEPNQTYELVVKKNGFNDETIQINTNGKVAGDKVYAKVPLSRAPGYIFEATVADWRPENSTTPVDAIENTTIEVYNNTTKKEELHLENHPSHTFHFRMEQGNHYTIMLRKEGYFNKRIEANVAVNGCLLCFEGMGKIRPGVADNLSHGNLTGTLGANISMRKIELDKSIKIDNIYYDLNKSYIRDDAAEELDKLVKILKDNPHISIELGSHTDARGRDSYNLKLSQARAEAAVEYIVSNGVLKDRITAKGYGELKLVNDCADGVRCNEAEHQENRRTEFMVTGIIKDQNKGKRLSEIIEAERFESMLTELSDQEVYIAPPVAKKVVNKTKVATSPTRKTTTPKQPQKTVSKQQPILTAKKVSAKPKAVRIKETDEGAFGEEKKKFNKVKKVVTERKSTIPANTSKLVENTTTRKPSSNIQKEEEPFKIGTKDPKWNTSLSTEVLGDIEQPKSASLKAKLGKGKFLKYRTRAKLISNTYTGYKIQIRHTEEELKPETPLFKEMGGIEVDVLPNETYSYMIGKFKTDVSAQKFLKAVLGARFPEAIVVKYKDGNRVR